MAKPKAYNVSLPKWPAMVVVGQPVTEEQAKEILIRTDSGYFCSNDKSWIDIVYDIFGFEISEHGYPTAESLQKIYREIGSIDLSYMYNDQIVSSYIGGPHGWCDWSGNIGCADYNIGKWPSVEGVHKDWKLIAEIFPYLDLTCQLFNGEYSEDVVSPVVAFRVKNGKVRISKPTKAIVPPKKLDVQRLAMTLLTNHGERGCTEQMLKDAVDFVKEKMRLDEMVQESN